MSQQDAQDAFTQDAFTHDEAPSTENSNHFREKWRAYNELRAGWNPDNC